MNASQITGHVIIQWHILYKVRHVAQAPYLQPCAGAAPTTASQPCPHGVLNSGDALGGAAGENNGAALLIHQDIILDAHADATAPRGDAVIIGGEVEAGLDSEDHPRHQRL
mmetsp:Transcript_20384/g.66125  ORF Transcript_20384/g.66125 Transcript_20384/m.66125 type:complete len:111 (-) Transcript_20384:881-1213(-)|eukprot:scaffold1434_cov134-Isochrysis_galbana.AAC.4